MGKKDTRQPCEIELKLTVDCEVYWDVKTVVSRGCFMNICMGGRGIGKTEQCNGFNLEEFRDYGNQFIYARRYKPELSGAGDLLNKWIDDVKYIGDKNGGGSYHWYGNTLGFAIPLSVAHNYKSGFDFSKVTTLVYDEAIIFQGGTQRYLPNEVQALLELASTVFRHRKNVRIIVLGNNLQFFNPFCEFFKVKVFNNLYVDYERSLQVLYSKDSAKLRLIEEDTPLYKLTMGTAYHDYHYNNVVMSNGIVPISKKNTGDKIQMRLILNSYTLNVYTRNNARLFVECKNKIYDDGISIIMLKNNEPNYFNVNYFKEKWYKYIMARYCHEEIDFDSQDAYNLLQEFLVLF